MTRPQLEPGRRYVIEIDAPGIVAVLMGVFLRWSSDSPRADAVFDIGTVGPASGRWRTTPNDKK